MFKTAKLQRRGEEVRRLKGVKGEQRPEVSASCPGVVLALSPREKQKQRRRASVRCRRLYNFCFSVASPSRVGDGRARAYGLKLPASWRDSQAGTLARGLREEGGTGGGSEAGRVQGS